MTDRHAIPPVWLLALVCLAVPLLSGCKQGSFLERRFTNFTAYYNTFYNAQRSFAKGEQSVQRANQPVDRDVYLSIYPEAQAGARSADFENAIRKGADVLREHPNSRWVDDALLLIGKSYFYQQNYVGAEQKFRETIALDSPLQDEARLWLLRTLIESRNYQPAIDVLQTSLEREDLSRRWAPLVRLMGGELHVRRNSWDEAAAFLEDGLREVQDRRAGARGQFLLAQVYETQGRYELAAEAYENVERFRPVYELSYAALYNHVRVLGLHGWHNEALRIVRRLSRDDKHFANRWELELLRGRILAASGDRRGALAVYDNLLIEPDANQGTLRGRVHYALAELFRDAYRDYSLAAAHFDTAATAVRRPGDQQRVQYAPSAIKDVAETAQVFKNFAAVSNRVAEMDSLLWLGGLDEATFDSLIVVYQERMTAEMLAAQTEQARRDAELSFQNPGMMPGEDGVREPFGQDATGGQESDHGFLFHRNPGRVQDGYFQFVRVWGDRPLIPNWRRREAIGAYQRSVAVARGEADAAVEDGAGLAPTVPGLDVSSVPRDSAAQALMRAERSGARYELANALFLNMNMPDSAAAWYRLVINEDWGHPVAQRAHYALAELHRSLGDQQSAERLYREIINNYPETEFARRAREQLNLPPVEEVVKDDTLFIAESAYADYYRQWQLGEFAGAFAGMLRVAEEFAETEVAPKAALAAGLIYTDWARREEMDLYAVIRADTLLGRSSSSGSTAASEDDARGNRWLPDTLKVETLYASLETQFPGTRYAERARLLRTFLEERRPQPVEDPAEALEQYPDEPLGEMHTGDAGGDAYGEEGRDELAEGTGGDAEPVDRPPADVLRPDEAADDDTLADPLPPLHDPDPEDRSPEEPAADPEDAPDETAPGAEEPPAEDPDVFSPEDIIRERGGYTWIFTSGLNEDAVERDIQRLKRMGYRAGVLAFEQEDGSAGYRGAIGQFATREAALDAREHLQSLFESEIWLLRIR